MSLTLNSALVASVFGIFGFFLAFSLKRATNIVLFGVFAYASLKALDYLGVATDWKLFENLIHILSQFGRTVLDLISAMLHTATFISIFCFLCGGVCGFVLRK
jgi:uncharacterized membrane protein (Fun14 family)